MNQADVTKLISKLRINIAPRHRNLKNPGGPQGRLMKLRQTVTGLIKHERIELNLNRADEARGYAERLISDAIRYGDRHQKTMDMADFWLLEKQYVHKLFKVLVPRFQDTTLSYTRLIRAPRLTPGFGMFDRAVLELRGHPYPPLTIDPSSNRQWLHNVLLDEARKEYRAKKFAEMAEDLSNEMDGLSKESNSGESIDSTTNENKTEINEKEVKESSSNVESTENK